MKDIYKLYYFPSFCRGEYVRIALEISKVNWKNIIVLNN